MIAEENHLFEIMKDTLSFFVRRSVQPETNLLLLCMYIYREPEIF
jgi:hypothetical protein